MKEIFGKNGALERIHPRFESREEQIRMSDFLLEILRAGESGIVEAGTGVGKTLAYLVPVVLHCLQEDRRAAVSTETRALQKQLIEKELPIVRQLFRDIYNLDFSYSLCLGGGNYACLRRYESVVSLGIFGRGDASQLNQLEKLFAAGGVFTRFDVRVSNDLWARVCRESESCNIHTCAHAARCPYCLARKEWAQSDLLVLNHYLYFSNIASGKTYLPQVDIVVFDEAHSLEDIASDQLGFSVGMKDMLEALDRFYKKSRKKNLLGAIDGLAERKKAIACIGDIEKQMGVFFEGLRSWMPVEKNAVPLGDRDIGGVDLLGSIREFHASVSAAADAVEPELRPEFDGARARMGSIVKNLEQAVYRENPDCVYWVEKNEDELLGDVVLKGQPVDVSEIMKKEVVGEYDSCIFVSATLAVNGDFSFYAGRLGIEGCRTLMLRSPFDFKKQVALLLWKKGSEPDEPDFIDRTSVMAAEIIQHLNGNCLLLFTSYRMLDQVKERLLESVSHPVFAQGEYSASEALERYLEAGDAVLMGTHSFWQGIDLPGDLLRGVLLMRLPFSVPDRPMVRAKMERLQDGGINPFNAYQVPSAVIRFKQGFGRLVRSGEDRGVVAVLDARIMTKGYGKQFIMSLPECTVVHSMEELKRSGVV
jgi:ATP-dependent DNA helicase DinG